VEKLKREEKGNKGSKVDRNIDKGEIMEV